MASAKRSLDRWSSLEKTMLNGAQARNSRTPLMELSVKVSTSDKAQDNE
jgi:hypothetical protein